MPIQLLDRTARVLFVLKRREDYNDDPSYSQNGLSTGLLNSANFVHDMLVAQGYTSDIAVVLDNNGIDKVVTEFKPTHVIIEALWVVPEKFEVLRALHPDVKWVVRYHSEIPFIANEGVAMSWLHGYVNQPNVYLGVNAPRYMGEIKTILAASGLDDEEIDNRVVFLPNYYPVPRNVTPNHPHTNRNHVNVGCFGAIRPLKNHLIQAIAALKFADNIGKALHFHVNVGRVEMKGDPILNNLRGLFDGIAENGHRLVIHTWAPHEEFIETIRQIDIGMQVSFSETFNIVAADMVSAGVPVVISNEIPWGNSGIADPTSSVSITNALDTTWANMSLNVKSNLRGLRAYVNVSTDFWDEFLTSRR